MPGHQIEWGMVLLNGIIDTVRLVHNGPVLMEVFIDVRNGMQKVSRVSQSMPSKGAQVGQLPAGSPNLSDISTGNTVTRTKPNSETDAARNDTDLTRLQEQLAQLCLDIQISQLSDDQEVTIRVAECPVVHVRVDHEHVKGNSLAQIRVSTSANCVQSINKVYLLVLLGQGEWCPLALLC